LLTPKRHEFERGSTSNTKRDRSGWHAPGVRCSHRPTEFDGPGPDGRLS
jgi:hypothetical protein